MFNKIILPVAFAVLFLFLPVQAAASQVETSLNEPAKTWQGGKLYRPGTLNVLQLEGTYLEMGRQYGHLMSYVLQDLYQEAVVDYFMEKKGLSRETMLQTAKGLYEFYPRRFKDLIQGMAQTSGLDLEEQIMLNALELYGTLSGCSAIFAWNDFTAGSPLITGRNYDWFESYTDFASSLTLTVFNPHSGTSAAIVTLAGVIYATTGINSEGIFIELNNGLPSGGKLTHLNRVHAVINLLAFLFDYETIEQVDAAMHSTRSNFSFIINIADQNKAFSYEWPPFGLKRRSGEENGLLVSTNHFAHPSWGLMLQDGTGFKSIKRRDNLLKLGRENKGTINISKMMKILDTSMQQGGATWPPEGDIRTVYQVIAEPETLRLWIKVPGHQDWTDVDLNDYFQ
ncbi:C45 family autoproteolytic acyltransferase/hydolase [Thioalkalivibrio nitratireducens]|uniref:C45 family autoproteolytic acyltransferase/hydolase n=1 Tax=Thioalkalivibrio nitratireducens TaxID=186931 RepID=UPI0006932B70|nr:C45 family peptidase [Thioalkalivibrio nitratireducens]